MAASWIFLALVALIAISAYSVSMKRLVTEAEAFDPVLVSAVVFTLVGIVAVGLWLVVGDSRADVRAIAAEKIPWFIGLDVALYTIAPILHYRAMRVLPVSHVAILQASVGVFALVGGAFLGTERFAMARWFGAALVVAAVAMIHVGAEKVRLSKAITMLLVACALYAAAAMVDQHLVSVGGLSPTLMMAIAYFLPGVILVGMVRVSHRRRVLARILQRRSVFANATALSIAYLCIYRAYGVGGLASGVTLILAAEAIVVVLLAAALLGEKELLARKLLAGIVVMVGVGLVR